VEVGVDVRDATIIVIEEAQRFGLSQLHQLRGRVGRGDKASACVLLYSEVAGQENMPAESRLRILRETEDGFRIAEEDLALRGGGELLSTRQSGSERTVFLDFMAHSSLIAQARDEARDVVLNDFDLKTEKGMALKLLLQLFERDAAV
jgi:ATP-dependent DNA helicase RecG